MLLCLLKFGGKLWTITTTILGTITKIHSKIRIHILHRTISSHTVRKTIPHRITSDHMGLTTIKIIRILTAQVTIRLRLISSLTITI